jgi:hypothetical protein
MLIARSGPGDLDRARQLLARCSGVAADHGYGGVSRMATAVLAQLG